MDLVYLFLLRKEGKNRVKQIETERLILRAPTPEDAVPLLPIRNSEFILQFNPTTPKNQEQLQEELMEEQDRTLILEKKEDGKVIGACFFGGDALRYQVHSQTRIYDRSNAGTDRDVICSGSAGPFPAVLCRKYCFGKAC